MFYEIKNVMWTFTLTQLLLARSLLLTDAALE